MPVRGYVVAYWFTVADLDIKTAHYYNMQFGYGILLDRTDKTNDLEL